jgi:hypothetical protein
MNSRKQWDAGLELQAWPDDELVDHAIATATQYGRQSALASEVAQARYLLLARMKGLRELYDLGAQRLAKAVVVTALLRAAIDTLEGKR